MLQQIFVTSTVVGKVVLRHPISAVSRRMHKMQTLRQDDLMDDAQFVTAIELF